MSPSTLALTIVLAALGIVVGILLYKRHVQINTRDTKELNKKLDVLGKKVDGIAEYLDGLPQLKDTGRKALFDAGMKARREYKYDEAIKFFRECLTNATKPSEKAALQILIGTCFFLTSRLSEAEGSYKEALIIAKKDNNKEGLVAALGNIGLVYQNKGEFDEALKYHQQALNITRENKFSLWRNQYLG